MSSASDVWVFGYGSLIWRPDLPSSEERTGWVHDLARRFWQGSPDHRGTPDAPGRVLTLIDAPGTRCIGRVYRLQPSQVTATMAALEHREKAGYQALHVPVQTSAGPVRAVVYRALPGNPDWLGPAPIDHIAAHIARSHGPSGPNREYVLKLDAALQALDAPAGHVAEVAEALRRHLA